MYTSVGIFRDYTAWPQDFDLTIAHLEKDFSVTPA
jgi:hypothetical protein